MAQCTKCGRVFADGSNFCPYCGTPAAWSGQGSFPAAGTPYVPYTYGGYYAQGYYGQANPGYGYGQFVQGAPAQSPAPLKRHPENGTPEHGEPAMLKLTDIKKDYKIASGAVHALKGVSLEFRKSEFVCILGQSGCGKTTLLNIIGGLDHYTSGDLVIQGKSTKKYRDRDWDVYRNHRIGFIFQTYNLIPHQTVLENVELALTIAGMGKAERRQRAKKALERVGLGSELKKRPNQLSGGQMQRVAIARALVNDPDILLADEPTGALDSKTSVEVMELIKEIANERLVIMVTHNGDLAEAYASRIVRLRDGLVEADSNPYIGDMVPAGEVSRKKKTKKAPQAKMGYGTSLALSFRNLLTKKGRTVITSVAGSIGIISVCLVLALSSGFNTYIRHTEEDMLSYYPVEVSETALDVNSVMSAITSPQDLPSMDEVADKVYINSFLTGLAQGVAVQNNISDEYISYVQTGREEHPAWFSAIQYEYGFDLTDALFTSMTVGGGDTGDPETIRNNSVTELKNFLINELIEEAPQYQSLLRFVNLFTDVINKMPGTSDFASEEYGKYVQSQYDIVAGHFPNNENEAVLVVGENNAVLDLTLVQLGFLTEERFLELFNAGLSESDPEELPAPTSVVLTDAEQTDETEEDVNLLPFNRVFSQDYVLYYSDELYRETGKTGPTDYPYEYCGTREDMNATPEQGIPFKISGILRLKDNFTYGCLEEGLNLTEAIVESYIRYNAEHSSLLKWITSEEAELDLGIDTMTAYRSPAEHLNSYYSALNLAQYRAPLMGSAFLNVLETMFPASPIPDTKEGIETYFGTNRLMLVGLLSMQFGGDNQKAQTLVDQIYANCLAIEPDAEGKISRSQLSNAMGNALVLYYDDLSGFNKIEGVVYYSVLPEAVIRNLGGNIEPNDIKIYAADFDSKEEVLAYLDAWNTMEGRAEEDKITYTDRVGLLMGMVQTMLDVITYVLVAFTAISLVVSSVMIGIITYVSVVERVKEIGVLRSLGARKKDIRNLFNAETFIIGLAAGLIGIAVTYLLSWIISWIIFSLSGIAGIATLPPLTALIMVVVSVVLTLISGLIPAQAAAKKDPVIALRTE